MSHCTVQPEMSKIIGSKIANRTTNRTIESKVRGYSAVQSLWLISQMKDQKIKYTILRQPFCIKDYRNNQLIVQNIYVEQYLSP